MRSNLVQTLAEFVESIESGITRASELAPVHCDNSLTEVGRGLQLIQDHAATLVIEVEAYARASDQGRSPEKVRSAITRLVRATESLKPSLAAAFPQVRVTEQSMVGCLYGFGQPRTANMDKAALVAQELMIDIWSMPEQELNSYSSSVRQAYYRLKACVDRVTDTIVQSGRLEAVA